MPATGTSDELTPSHYRGGNGIQPWDVIDAYNLDFYEGTLITYLLRWRAKDGPGDLHKARHYLDRVIARQQAEAAAQQQL